MEKYLGGTTNNNATEYAEKKKYTLFLQQSGHQMLDTLYRDTLYGFINRDYEVVAPTPDTGDFGAFAEGVPALPWVAPHSATGLGGTHPASPPLRARILGRPEKPPAAVAP